MEDSKSNLNYKNQDHYKMMIQLKQGDEKGIISGYRESAGGQERLF